ncbi:MAG TPA: LysR family transcriptional regulator [Streptosporangiaceae bacterium]|jgi:DNA-binding transcriptional LysR family regulator
MELRVLRYFLAVADTGSVTAAARAVHVAQPSVSRQLRALEHELGAALFVRGPGPLRLSAAGKRFRPIARDLVTRAGRAADVMRSADGERSLILTVLAPPATVNYLLAPFIAAHGADLPMLDARQEEPLRVFETLARDDTDFAISTIPPPGQLESRSLGDARIWAQVPPGHRLAGRASVPLPELLSEPLIVMNQLNLTRLAFDEAVTEISMAYEIAHEAESSAIAQALTAAGRGVCVVTDGPRFGLRALRVEHGGGPLSVPLYAGWDPTHYASAIIDRVVDRIRTYHETRSAAPPLGD